MMLKRGAAWFSPAELLIGTIGFCFVFLSSYYTVYKVSLGKSIMPLPQGWVTPSPWAALTLPLSRPTTPSDLSCHVTKLTTAGKHF